MVGDTLGRGRVYVSDNVEGGFQVMLVGAAAVGGQEGHCGSKIGAGVSCKLCEAADQGLASFTTRDKELVAFVDGCQRDENDGTT